MAKLNEILDACDSTNELLKSVYDSNLENGTWVAAKKQLRGKGRGQHHWESLEGNIHLSIFFSQVPSNCLTWIPLKTALTLRQFLQFYLTRHDIQVKWPNDLLVNDQKIAGVLCEVVSSFNESSHDLVCGIGINVNQRPKEMEVQKKSTSLMELMGSKLNCEEMTHELAETLKTEIQNFNFNEIQSLRKAYEKAQWLKKGDPIKWYENHKQKEGTVLGLGKYGDLTVKEIKTDKIRHLFGEEVEKLLRRV